MDKHYAILGRIVVWFTATMMLLCLGAALHAWSIAAGNDPPIDRLIRHWMGK